MTITFLDEIGVEPVAFTGISTTTVATVGTALHRLYSRNRINKGAKFICGRYLHTPQDNRELQVLKDNRYINTLRDVCE